MKKRQNWLCIGIAFLIFSLCPATAHGEETEDKTLSPYFFIENADPAVDSFPLKDTKVSTTVNGVIAETYVTQTYSNEGTTPINASYNFPASTKVTVHGMKMEIGDKIVTAKIKEREEAKEEFEEAKSEGKSASLLEEQRPNVFSMSVANIMPGDTVRIELHYTEMIVPTDGIYQFVFPTVVGPRYTSPSEDQSADNNQWVDTPYLPEGNKAPGTYQIDVNMTCGVPITAITSKSHEIQVKQENKTSAAISLANPGEYAGNRDFILDYKLTGDDISSGLTLNQGEKENFFMLMVQPPERVTSKELPPREYIFVLDVSGSMYGYPLDTAKDLIRNLVGNLRETDRFNVLLFSDDSKPLAEASVPATAENVQKAFQLIDEEFGGGGTDLAPALQTAIDFKRDKNFSRSIVMITDGYISDEAYVFNLINNNLNTTNFFSFGIGSSVNRYLIDGIAQTGFGESFVVTDSEDAAGTADRFRQYIQSPVLTDINVIYDGFDVYDIEPTALPTLFAQRPLVLFGKWRGEPGGTVRITGKRGEEDYVQEIPVSKVVPSENSHVIPYLWARTKLERLTDYNTGTGDQEEIKKEVTALGLEYSMMTPYTSFIAVIDTVRNKDGNSTDVDQPLPLPENVSNFAVGGYASSSEPGMLLLLSGLALILAVTKVTNAKTLRKKKMK